MKKSYSLILAAFLLTLTSFAQTPLNAVTDKGDEVLLYPNGEWAFKDKDQTLESDIPINTTEVFKKSDRSNFLLKSNRTNIGLYLNPKNWSFKKQEATEDSEYILSFKGDHDIYAMLITERFVIPIENLAEVAFINAAEVDPNLVIDEVEYRTVNDVQVIMMKMKANIHGMKIVYLGYYFSNETGSNQLVTYTQQESFAETEKHILELLNGLVIQP